MTCQTLERLQDPFYISSHMYNHTTEVVAFEICIRRYTTLLEKMS